MNEAHKVGRMKNRYSRLVKKCLELPTDGNKRERKQFLEAELKKLKLIK